VSRDYYHYYYYYYYYYYSCLLLLLLLLLLLATTTRYNPLFPPPTPPHLLLLPPPIHSYRRIEWQCDKDNLYGRQCGEKLGFKQEGLLRKHRIVREANRDSVVYSLVNTEWREGGEERMRRRLGVKVKGMKFPVRRVLQVDEGEEGNGEKKKHQ